MNNIINQLRSELQQPQGSQPRALPEVAIEMQNKLLAAAHRINAMAQLPRMGLLAAVLYSNAQLAQEVNELREQLGYTPLPVYDPLTGKRNGH